jgi:hypothetical protein
MANPNLQVLGGPAIGEIQLVPVIWGNGWPYDALSPLPGQLLSFLQFFVGPQSPHMQMLREYSTDGITIGPGTVVNNQMVTAPGTPLPSISDREISATLSGWIGTPNFPQPGTNTIYMIFLPQSVSVTFLGKTSCQSTNSFGGYHNWTGSQTSQSYIVIACCVSPTTPYSQVLNWLTTLCSHELCEVITDPVGNGWIDTSTNPTGEIGDFCQNFPAGTVQAGGGWSYQVQSIWSREQNNCVLGPPVRLISLAPRAIG